MADQEKGWVEVKVLKYVKDDVGQKIYDEAFAKAITREGEKISRSTANNIACKELESYGYIASKTEKNTYTK